MLQNWVNIDSEEKSTIYKAAWKTIFDRKFMKYWPKQQYTFYDIWGES